AIGDGAAVQGPIASILQLLTGRLVDLPLGKNAVRGNPSDRRRQCPIVWSAVPAPVPRAMWLFGSLTTRAACPPPRSPSFAGPPLVVVEELLGRFRSILD
ncbi:MAG TPA: hypothetical protein VIM19_08655, partial [Actinomycetes bacterium]